MASLYKKVISGKPYWYLREMGWVDGKPKMISQRYVGAAADIEALLDAREEQMLPERTRHLDFGAVAAAWGLLADLGVAAVIDEEAGARPPGLPLSPGTYLALAALNRVVDPCSKRAFADWWRTTAADRFATGLPESIPGRLARPYLEVPAQRTLPGIASPHHPGLARSSTPTKHREADGLADRYLQRRDLREPARHGRFARAFSVRRLSCRYTPTSRPPTPPARRTTLTPDRGELAPRRAGQQMPHRTTARKPTTATPADFSRLFSTPSRLWIPAIALPTGA